MRKTSVGPSETGSSSTASIPEYAWFLIAIGILLIAAVGFMAYRKYKKGAKTLKHVASIEEEIEQLDFEDDPMELNAKHAYMNPLATGVAGNEWATVDKYLDEERARARSEMELATVNVEEEYRTQQFAAQRPVSRQFTAEDFAGSFDSSTNIIDTKNTPMISKSDTGDFI